MQQKSYDLSSFNSKKLHTLTFLYCYARFFLVAAAITAAAGVFMPLFFIATLLLVLVFGYFSLFGGYTMPGNAFARANKLSRPFLENASNYLFLYEEYKTMKQSALFKEEQLVWGVPVQDITYAVMFLKNGDVVAWTRLQNSLPHIVIDATANNTLFGSNVSSQKLPKHKISLEGNFPEHFNVYAEQNAHITALQLLSPDRMQTLIQKLGYFDFEVKGNHVKIYVKNAQKNSEAMTDFFKVLHSLHEDLKIKKIHTIRT